MLEFIKSISKNLIAKLYILFGFIKRAKKNIANQDAIVSIYFHNPSLKTFNDCIQWLIDNNFEFIDARDLLNSGKAHETFQKNKVIITIDDGWRENLLNIIPIAHFNKIPITIFITTEPLIEGGGYWWSYIKAGYKRGITTCTVPFLKTLPNINRMSVVNYVKSSITLERESMTVEELKAITNSPYVHIGAHTLTHPILTNCSVEQVDLEISQSKSKLDAIIPTPVYSFSFPNGDYTNREVDLLKKHGYQLAFTTKPAFILPNNGLDLFRLPRFEVLDNASLDENICRMMGVWFKK